MLLFRKASASEAAAPLDDAPSWLAPGDEARAWSAAPAPRAPLRLAPFVKIGAAGGLFAIGAFAIASEQGFVASDNAVVSTRLISLRAPIEGIAAAVDGGPGAAVRQGETIVRLGNPLFNDQRVVDLRETLGRLRAARKNADAERAALAALAVDLRTRAAQHAGANAARLAGLAAEGEKALAALDAKERQARYDLERRAPLEARGIVSKAEAQRLQSTLDAARNDVEAQRGRLQSLRAEATAAAAGVLSSSGGIDVAYSAQRADEVAIQIARLTHAIGDLDAEAAAVQSRLANEEHLASLARSAELKAPVGGMIWRLGASAAERLAAGDMAAELVDCAAPTLLVAIPQDRFSDVKIGGLARYRLSGERAERTGAVLSVAGQGDLTSAGHYAALPIAETRSTIVAQVKMEADANGPCLIGRTARVLLPTSGGGVLDRLRRRLF